MVEIKPFKATILNPKLENRVEMICPVYDTIDATPYNRGLCKTLVKTGADSYK